MPYWGLTIGQLGVADVMAYLKAAFKGGAVVAQAHAGSAVEVRAASARSQKNGEGAGRLPVENQSVPNPDATIQAEGKRFLADGSTGGLCDVSRRQGQWARVHGRGLDSAAQKLHLRLDDEGHPGWGSCSGSSRTVRPARV